MQLRHKEASDYSLYTKDEGKHTHVHAAIPFAEGFVVGDATSLLFSSQAQLNNFLKSEARPNHRRFADRLFQLTNILHDGEYKTIFGILMGVAGEIMAPGQGQRANVELVLYPTEGLNPGLVKLVAKTRTGQGVAKDKELLLDYGDAFDLTLPVLASGADLQMDGPMDRFMNIMKPVSTEAQGINPSSDAGPVHNVNDDSDEEDKAPLAKRLRINPAAAAVDVPELMEGIDDEANPFQDMKLFGQGAWEVQRETFGFDLFVLIYS